MNRYLDFTGGKKSFNIDDMLWNDEATYNALNDVFRAFGDNYIIYGCTGTTSITAGYVMLDGELLKVDAHTATSTHFEKVTTYDAGGDVTFIDGTPRQTWQKNRATITAGSGNLEYATANRLENMEPSWTAFPGTFSAATITAQSLEYRIGFDNTIEIRGQFTFAAAAIGTKAATTITLANWLGGKDIERKYALFEFGYDTSSSTIRPKAWGRIYYTDSIDSIGFNYDLTDATSVADDYSFYVKIPLD